MTITTPEYILKTAAQTIAQRGVERDTTAQGGKQERSMAACVTAFNAIESTNLTERQGWAFMAILKLARAANSAKNGKYNPDDYIDGAAYIALAAEAANTKASNTTPTDTEK